MPLGIPGTIGGAVKMNAGAYGGEMKDYVVKTRYMDLNGEVYELESQDHEFDYRTSIFKEKDWIILDTILNITYGDAEEIKGKIEDYREKRTSSQPIEKPSAGSTFKRGEDFITAKLIDEAGLKGCQVGGAEVSTKHAGFIINNNHATAKDVIELIEYVKKTIYEKFGKELQLEIQIMGEL